MGIEELIRSGAVRPFAGGDITPSTDLSLPLAMLNPSSVTISVKTPDEVSLIVVHTVTNEASVSLTLGEGARVSLTEVFMAEAFADLQIEQGASSRLHMTVVQLRSANAAYRVNLSGEGAHSRMRGLFLASESEHCTVCLTTNHLVPNCTSDALVKGVASGRSTGEFRGMVYVAKDAQHTDARQQSRNIELEQAHIVTMPQLEIYADDVQCSHGATVGRMDDESVLYMRQRGLSRRDAERLQIEGFANDIVNSCAFEPLREVIAAEVVLKLEKM